LTSSSRLEFADCRMQTVTMNGDPAILMDGVYTFGAATPTGSRSISATTHMTGGVRFDTPSGAGRAKYDCTMSISMQIGSDGTTSQPSVTSSGTITWEQPLGTVSVHACGA